MYIRQVDSSEHSTDSRNTFLVAHEAIRAAYMDARQHFVDSGFEWQIVQTGYAHDLNNFVNHRVFDALHTRVNAEFVPNSTGSAHHLRLRIDSWVVTISAVRHPSDRPRFAHFREGYSRQSRFDFDGSGFVTVVQPMIGEEEVEYIQILHGPDSLNPRNYQRMALGFVRVAYPDVGGSVRRPHQDYSDFLDEHYGAADTADNTTVPVENIDDPFADLKVRNPNRAEAEVRRGELNA